MGIGRRPINLGALHVGIQWPTGKRVRARTRASEAAGRRELATAQPAEIEAAQVPAVAVRAGAPGPIASGIGKFPVVEVPGVAAPLVAQAAVAAPLVPAARAVRRATGGPEAGEVVEVAGVVAVGGGDKRNIP